MKNIDIAVIGGGAGGLAAAIEAKRTAPALKVTVMEQLPRVGKKILATGNGRCNLGNISAESHPYTNAEFAAAALQKYSTQSLIEFFKSMGLYTRADSQGRLYPLSNTAAAVLDALRFECENLGVELLCDYKVTSIKKEKNFIINQSYCAKKVILACGGKAAPSQGSNGSGYPLLEALGHSITPLSPSLVQLVTDTVKTKALKGVRVTASLALSTGGAAKGEILFTDYGLSGIASMDLSRFVKPEKAAAIILDFATDFNIDELQSAITATVRHNPSLPAENILSGFVPKALGTALIKSALGFIPKASAEIKPAAAKRIAEEMKHFSLPLKGTKSFNDAQVTKGGARVNQFNPQTLESKKLPGIYACGELLDVDGSCGGFNLAWAFASGRLAGKSATQNT